MNLINYFRTCRLIFLGVSLLLLLTKCTEIIDDDFHLARIKGQVYSINTPGSIPDGWTPPPLEIVSTIVVMNDERRTLTEMKTNSKGYFSFEIPAGTYYLKVKESRIPNEAGPFKVQQDETIIVQVFYDNGMR